MYVTVHFLKHPKALKVLHSFFFSKFKEQHMLPLFEEFRIHSCKLNHHQFSHFGTFFFLQLRYCYRPLGLNGMGSGLYILKMVAAMLRCFFITNRTPAYIFDMLNLSETVKSVFMSSEFSIRHKHGALNSIWSDMATEKTNIKMLKVVEAS